MNMWSAFKIFFSNWTAQHWLNFGIFLLGTVISTLGITASTPWADLPKLLTPLTTLGLGISLLGFLLQTATNKPRDPTLGTRSTDPADTERVVQVGQKVVPVPPINPGRPVDPDLKEP
jgi:hypothetical protein